MSKGDEPVIPQESYITGQRRHWKGLTIREHFAGLAMNGLLANPGDADAKEVARLATLHADALLAELVGEKEES